MVRASGELRPEILAIVNPAAGRGRAARAWRQIRTTMPEPERWDCVETRRPGEARELAAAAVGRYTRVVVVGGDGTVCEVANGVADSSTALAVIPLGTGNDLAANLGVPTDPLAAARLAATGAPRAIDVGEMRTSSAAGVFVNVAGFGFDAEVAWRVNRMSNLIGGTLPYLAGVLQAMWRYRAHPMRLTLDGQVIDRRVFLVAVGNCAAYGGGMRIVPDARPDDGVLDVCIVNHLSRLEILKLLPRIYSGGHVCHPAVEMFRCREISADAVGRVLCQADGELVGGLPAHFAVRPAALRFVTGPAARRPS